MPASHPWCRLAPPILAAWLAMGLALAPGGARAQAMPSQQPLLSRDGGGAKPNVMLTLDDSGSMRFIQMPELMAYVGQFRVTVPDQMPSGSLHPQDLGVPVISAIPGSMDWRQRFARSADTNTTYYNPQVRYQPWIRADGTRLPAADPANARLSPLLASPAVNLRLADNARLASWCFGTGGSTCQAGGPTFQPYQPGLYYRLRKDASGYLNPQVAQNYDEYNVNIPGRTFTRFPARSDCAGDPCTQAEELQNFANWFVYYRNRLLLAKASVAEALQPVGDIIRLGYGRINSLPRTIDGNGPYAAVESGVRDFTAERKAEVFNWLFGISAEGVTPLRSALQSVGEYFASASSSGPWSDTPGKASNATHKSCRRAYNILVTDGYWSDDNTSVGNADNTAGEQINGAGGRSFRYQPSAPYKDLLSNTLADVAMAYWKRDLRPDLDNNIVPTPENPAFWQSLTHFIVGLGVRGTLDPTVDGPKLADGSKSWGADRIDDLWHAAVNSRGQYVSAHDPDELRSALESALRTMAERELSEAGVAVAAPVLQAGNRKYVPRYRTGSWTGDVEAYALDATGQAGAQVWTAKSRLPDWSRRNIATWDAGQAPARAVDFNWSQWSAATQARVGGKDALEPAGLQAGKGRAVVDFLRGDRSNEGAAGLRTRKSVLGDIVNSTPFFADAADQGLGALPGLGASYFAYLSGPKSARAKVLYVGANDGMLHGFKDTLGQQPQADGTEVFAYVPQAVQGQLARLADPDYGTSVQPHRYFVDGSLSAFDAFLPAPGASTAQWRNILVGSTGAGAPSVFAIDITEPSSLGPASVRWDLVGGANGDSALGYVLFPVEGGRLRDGSWVALFGNGYGASTAGAQLFMVDLGSGRVQRVQVSTGGTAGSGLGGVTAVKDAEGNIVALYAGDLDGNLWRLDYDPGAAGRFRVTRQVFRGQASQPVLQPPAVVPLTATDRLVVFGTGRLFTDADAADTSVQAVYAVRDPIAAASVQPAAVPTDLAPRSIATFNGTGSRADQVFLTIDGLDVDWVRQRGWRVDLSLDAYPGLRVLQSPTLLGQKALLVGAMAPARQAQPCTSESGRALNLVLPMLTGKTPSAPILDTNGDGQVTAADRLAAGYATAADGRDAVLRTATPTAGGGSTSDGGSPGGGSTTDPLTSSVCANPGSQLFSIQNSTGGQLVCMSSAGPRTVVDRAWRRILNPPIK